MIRFFSGTLTYQFFDTSPIALQKNFDDSVNIGLLRVVKRRPGANRWRILCFRCLFVNCVIIKLIINTIRHHEYWLSIQYEIMWFGLKHKHEIFVRIKSRDFTIAGSRSKSSHDFVDFFTCAIEVTCRT